MRKKIALLGSTGSVGKSTLAVARHLKEELEIVALTAKSNIEQLELQAKEFCPKCIAVFDEKSALLLQKKLPSIPVIPGIEGLKAVASLPDADFVMLAMTGSIGVIPAIEAIKAKKQIGIANKEIFASAGELISKLSSEKGVTLLPVDSEHCAIFQCLKGEKKETVRRLILTASGGPFLRWSESQFSSITPVDAMKHPHWNMGDKVKIDCSTLMNKGLEMIEARWLFGIEPQKIEAIIHPQSRIHSFVEFIDGSLLAQLSEPDMQLPIQYALTYPRRKPGVHPPFDFAKNHSLTFFAPNYQTFPCLKIAIDCLQSGQSYPCFLNGANEVLVERFIQKKISWLEIGQKLEKLISSHRPQNLITLEAVLETDAMAREKASVI